MGGGTNATLTQSQEIIPTTNKSSSVFAAGLSGMRTWNMSFEGMYLVSAEVQGTSLGVTAGGVTLKGIKTVSLSMDSELIDSSSSSSTVALDRELVASTRKLTLTVTGELFDFDFDASSGDGDEGLAAIVARIDGSATSSIAMIVTFDSAQSYAFTCRPTSFTTSTPHDGIMDYTVVLESVGSVSAPTTTSADAGVIAVMADFFASDGAAEVGTALLTTGTTDRMEWTGSAFPESLSIDIDWNGTATLSGTLQGSGKLTNRASS